MQRIGTRGSSATRYGLVGLANTIIYASLLYVFLDGLSLTTSVAVSLAYLIAILFHFSMNRIYVFRASDGRIAGQLWRYSIFAVSSYLFSLAVVSASADWLHLSSLTVVGVNVIATMLFGYALSRLWVFR